MADKDVVDAIRGLIDRVVVHETKDGGVEAEVIGHVGALMTTDTGEAWGGTVVARGGLEPPTP